MPKNVEVVDSQGNVYEATYPKRARGLVKNGRARYITDGKIELLRPPRDEIAPTVEATQAAEPMSLYDEVKTRPPIQYLQIMEDIIMSENINNTINPSEILSRIDAIIADSAHISRALAAAENVDIIGAQQTHPIATIVLARETTNQKLVALLEKMYDDAKPQRPRRPLFEVRTAPAAAAEPTECCDEECDCEDAPEAEQFEPNGTFFGMHVSREKLDEFKRDAEKFVRDWVGVAQYAGRTAAEASKEAYKAARDSVRNSRPAPSEEAVDAEVVEDDVDVAPTEETVADAPATAPVVADAPEAIDAE